MSLKSAVRNVLDAAGLGGPARAVYRRAKSFGFRRECPICGTMAAKFNPEGYDHAVLYELEVVGGGRRDGVICPTCGSGDRERLVYLFLKRKGLVPGPRRLMHGAPEGCLGGWLRAQVGEGYLSIDLEVPDVDQNLDLTAIPYEEASFDAVICNHMMEHIPEDWKAMREICRILKPGGWAVLQVPIALKLDKTVEDPSVSEVAERERRFGQYDHIRIYTAGDYIARLTKAGFKVEPFRWTDEAANFGGASNRYGLLEKEVVFFARKPA